MKKEFEKMSPDNRENKKAVVLCSGGLDSTTVLYIAISQGFDVYPVSFKYDQRHDIELRFLEQTLKKLNLVDRWVIFKIDYAAIKSSALLNKEIDVPKDRDPDHLGEDIPISYVPLRNTIFLSHAAALAESIGARDIFIGANILDYSGYPDCRPEYLDAIERALTLGSRYVEDPANGFKIHAPLIKMKKSEIIKRGLELGVDYSLTWSCYDPLTINGRVEPCGRCDSCILRKKGFDELEINQPRT